MSIILNNNKGLARELNRFKELYHNEVDNSIEKDETIHVCNHESFKCIIYDDLIHVGVCIYKL